ncbi:MAG: anthranilate phosphoribosyltransferase [Methanomassiliicoccales archaeon]|nr:anthranilate phosphoribosyltransferase [Methanomassiliicoccales archaeon]
MSQAQRVEQARSFASAILAGKLPDRAIAERLEDMGREGENVEDLLGMLSVFYPLSHRLRTRHPMVMDLCGTGGAPVRSFNVSSISSFVLAAAGVPVAKHGNRSSRGSCGSADLMEVMGANVSPGFARSQQMLEQISFTFLFAPAYHPAMRHVVKARKMASGRTMFNVMGPLMNPVLGPRRQLMGVFSPELLDIIPPVLQQLEVDRAMVVHGEPGIDEVSLCGQTLVAEMKDGSVERYVLTPEEFGFRRCHESLVGEMTPQASARACCDLIRGKMNERRDMVLLNSGCALYTFGAVPSIVSGISLAERTIDAGKAFAKLQEYLLASRLPEVL